MAVLAISIELPGRDQPFVRQPKMKSRRGGLFAPNGCTPAERDYICQGAAELGVYMSDARLTLLARFLRDLSTWNLRFRMVGTDDRKTFLRVHILDALAPASILGASSSLVDIGSGAGLPGIPLSIACPGLTVTLVDSRRVRANFLRDITRRLHLQNTRIVEARIERWVKEQQTGARFDATIARAWRGLPELLRVSAGIIRTGGAAIAMMGPWHDADSHKVSQGAGEYFEDPHVIQYRLPGGREQRSLAVFRRR